MVALPVAVAIALSPFAIIPAVLLLLADDARRTTAAYLAGWLGGVATVTALAVLLSDALAAWQAPSWLVWIRVALGVVLVALGIRALLKRPDPDAGGGWADRLAGVTPARAARLGVLLSMANPKVIVLAAAGGATVGATVDGAGAQMLAVGWFAVVASLGVALPLLLHLLLGRRAEAPLRALGSWLEANGDRVLGVVLLVLGGYVLLTAGY